MIGWKGERGAGERARGGFQGFLFFVFFLFFWGGGGDGREGIMYRWIKVANA